MSQSDYYDVHRVFLRSFTVRDIAEPLLSDRDRGAPSLADYLAGTPFVYAG